MAEPFASQPRPRAVVLFLFVLPVITGILALGTARFLWIIASHLAEISAPVAVAIALGWRVALITALAVTWRGVSVRKKWSRWVGFAALLAFTAWCVTGTDTTQYANDAERAGGATGRILITLLLAWWAYAFAFSDKARRYFSA